MRNRIIYLLFGSMLLLLISSCCNEKDRVFWFPDEAVRYYNDHDTVKFYCPETDVYESYMVCNRDTSLAIEQYQENRFCEYAVYSYGMRYILNLDSCGGSKGLEIFIDFGNPGNIAVHIRNQDNLQGSFYTSFDESSKFSIDINDYTYDNVIEIPGSELYEIPSILFSYEYGVIQIQYENQTFSLINYEN